MYQVSLEKFNGPLDLLLSLIEERKLAIGEVVLSQVTGQFLEHLKEVQESENYQRVLADFLVVASRLILIKSRSLLPNLVLSQEEEGDIKELENRLNAYREIKIWGRELGKWAKDRLSYFGRDSYLNMPKIYYPPQNISAKSLCEKYTTFLKTLPQIEKLEEQNLQRVVTLDQKMLELKTRITIAVEASFADLSGGIKNKIDVILNFLAVLTLFRARVLELFQNEIFGDIKIKRCAEI